MKQMSEHARCAKAIRAELKKLFPETKFSVTSQTYSGGDSVRVSWTDGVQQEVITELTRKYQYGSFDGMTDCYNYDNKNADLPQAKYIQTSRHMSEQYFQEYFEHIKKHYSHCDHLTDIDQADPILNSYWKAWTARNLIYRALHKIDLTKGLVIND